MTDNRTLEIVDNQGAVIGEELRATIHKKGLLHREVHIWLYTTRNSIVFQHRAKNKDTFPDLLDATAGGHVEKGDDWISSAIKELQEETGIIASPDDLRFCFEDQTESRDSTGAINNALRRTFGYLYTGRLDDLVIEKGKSIGFEEWPLDKLLNLDVEDRSKFIPVLLTKKYLNLYKQLLNKI